MNIFRLFTFCLITFLSSIAANTQADTFYVSSAVNGTGTSSTLTTPTNTIISSRTADNGIRVSVSGGSDFWTASFSAAFDAQIEVGNYEDATRSSFRSPTVSGLDVSGNGSGCNTLTGRYVVLEVAYDGSGNVTQFAADFIQFCDASTTPMYGSVRINSTLPIPTITPNAVAGRDRIILENNTIQLDGSLSTAGNGFTMTSYAWTQVSGTTVTINNANTATADFLAPDVAPAGETIVLRLTVTNSNAITSSDDITFSVADIGDARSYLIMNSQTGDSIGQGQKHFYDTNDGVFTSTGTDTDEARIRLDNGDSWSINFEAIEGLGLSVGEYTSATRFPFNDPTVPGLSISGDGRGCNTLTGTFEIIAITRDGGGIVNSLAADFEQHCGGGNEALLGRIRYNYIENSTSIQPFAFAGSNRNIVEATTATLYSTNSYDPDGSIASYLWTQQSGTTVTLSDATNASPTFTVPAPPGATEDLVFQLQVTDNSGDTDTDLVTLTNYASTVPIANAGSNQNIVLGTTATLDGSASTDPNGTISSYLWTQLSGTTVTLSDTSAVSTSFIVPTPANYSSEALVFQLQVTDNDGETAVDTVTLTIADPTVPLANAGPDKNVVMNTTVTLDGSASKDNDGTITSYQWSQISGPTVTITNPATASTNFTAPILTNNITTTLEFQLQVTDDDGQSSTDNILINVFSSADSINPGITRITYGNAGCTINKNTAFDPTFFIMLIISSLYLLVRNKNVRKTKG